MELYYAPYSPPSRAVRLVAEHLGLEMNLNLIDVMKGEQFAPEYAEINPQKKVPFLIDGDLKLGESRAIIVYLADKYGEGSRILPQDPCGRALVNQALQFDIGTLFRSIRQYYFPVIFKMEEEYRPDRYVKLQNAFEILDKMLESGEFVAGKNLTVADLSIVASVTTAEAFGFDLEPYKNVLEWIDRVKVSTPGYEEVNEKGIELLKEAIASFGQ
ncbi:hypothetical protein QAD02_018057 [Eretmocerus hayati]|uniref:Uncharacterized protein n=1 Tax=Eretmocerus hayati TaxID=131215 RepID=A0ACC2PFR4_9HYME|nr:hypothetical protein QAD02_018057 [Eretmocerus hayati]